MDSLTKVSSGLQRLFGGRDKLEGLTASQINYANLSLLPQRIAGCIEGSERQLRLPKQDTVQKDDPTVGRMLQQGLVGLSNLNGPLCF